MSGLLADIDASRGDFQLTSALAVAPGEVLALLGPNGSGKSTLLRALAGLLPLTAGRVELNGQVLDEPDAGVFLPAERRRVGLLFQERRLFPHLTVLDNVAYAARADGKRRRQARADAQPWLERFDLASLASRRAGQLSGGQAQRVALARVLTGSPQLLLLDEPFTALDVDARTQLRELLATTLPALEIPVILVTHEQADVDQLATRQLAMTTAA
jgi:molybdate transport system ATP-binding protein